MMTWSVDKLKAVVKARGERFPQDRTVGEALLAHERYKGRTEEEYNRDKAYRDLTRLLDLVDRFPDAQPGEYPGMKQLRAIARDMEREREAKKPKVEASKTEVAKSAKTPEPELELEDEDDMER